MNVSEQVIFDAAKITLIDCKIAQLKEEVRIANHTKFTTTSKEVNTELNENEIRIFNKIGILETQKVKIIEYSKYLNKIIREDK